MSEKATTDESLLSESDVRGMVRLLGEVAALDGSINDKRRYLMDGLAAMVDADFWIWSMFRICEDGNHMTIGWLHGGLSEEQVALVAAASTDVNMPQPENERLLALIRTEQHFTRRRRQMIPNDDGWYSHPHTRTYRQGWLDDFIYSIYRADEQEGVWSAIGFHRAWGRPPFSARDARIVHIITSEVAWLHQAAIPGSRGDGVPQLPPRLRAVLALLIDGHSRKRIAMHLRLSVHTVADYIKDIYRHFGVSGRVELLHRFMAGDGGDVAR